jgi:hypothetical protein
MRLVINQSVGYSRVELIPEVRVIFRYMLPKVTFDLLCTLYNLCIILTSESGKELYIKLL